MNQVMTIQTITEVRDNGSKKVLIIKQTLEQENLQLVIIIQTNLKGIWLAIKLNLMPI